MKTICESIFRLGLFAFPRSFRSEYEAEMITVFHERVAELSPLAAVGEAIDVFSAGARMRLERTQTRQALIVTLAAAMFVTSFALRDVDILRSNTASGRIDFNAEDPAGVFTLTVIDGRPVGATLNRVPVSPDLIVTRADSITILRPDGRTELTVAFDAERGHIAWEPRQPQSSRTR
jgi:hypothetical protein